MTCSICLETVRFWNGSYLNCGHPHHIQCISTMHNMTCPICRKLIDGWRITTSVLDQISSGMEHNAADTISNVLYMSLRDNMLESDYPKGQSRLALRAISEWAHDRVDIIKHRLKRDLGEELYESLYRDEGDTIVPV